MRTLRVSALAALLFPLVATSSVLAAQEDHLTVTAPLYRGMVQGTQHQRSRNDLWTTVPPVRTSPTEVETTGAIVAEPSDPLTVHVPLYREQIRDAQQTRSRSDMGTTVEPIWVVPTAGEQ